MFLAVELRGAIAVDDVIKMFQCAGIACTGADFVERELDLRETRAVHHRGDVDDDDGVLPAGQHAGHEAVRCDERRSCV